MFWSKIQSFNELFHTKSFLKNWGNICGLFCGTVGIRFLIWMVSGAVHLCALSNDAAQLQALLEAGASPNLQDAQGRSPAMIAAEFGHLPIMKLLDTDARKPNMKLKVCFPQIYFVTIFSSYGILFESVENFSMLHSCMQTNFFAKHGKFRNHEW